MSQTNVERVIGILATDEAIRRRFTQDPRATLREMMEKGMEFNPCELWALARLDPAEIARFSRANADRIHPWHLNAGVS